MEREEDENEMMDFNVEDFLNENFTEDGSQKKMLDDEEEEEMSESMISIRKLKTALRNEKVLLFSQREEENLRHIHTQKNKQASPELYKYEEKLVEEIGEQINSQQNMIDDLEDHFESVIYQMDLDRVKYILTDYLRVRLKKIQRFVFYLTSSNELLGRLSKAEVKFAKTYLKIAMGHFEKSVLQHIPERYRNLKESIATVPRPNLDAFVFFKVNEDIGEISIVGAADETVELLQGDTKVMRYRDIRPYVSDNAIRLL